MKKPAIVIGSGPNGLSAAVVLARAGMDVLVREAASQIGGGASSAELTLPGFVHDRGSAVHPLGISSPFFSSLDLPSFGLRWIWSPHQVELAHPLDDGTAVLLHRDIDLTAAQFGEQAKTWRKIFRPLVEQWEALVDEVFAPPHLPRHPFLLARFGLRAAQPATLLAKYELNNPRAAALFGGVAAHSALKLSAPLSSAFGLVLLAAGHAKGWPIPEGGAQSIANALNRVLLSYGGRIETNARVDNLDSLDPLALKMCDVTPQQLLALDRSRLPATYRRALRKFLYGPGVFKVDWALSEPIPWTAADCRKAITVHLGGGFDELVASEERPWHAQPPDKPFVLLAQPSLFDRSRAPQGRHTAWAYCHVPNGWNGSALLQIENQIERFAPGFRECVLARSAHNPVQMQSWNANLVGGDVNAGAFTVKQFALRPTWRSYRTPLPDVYLCSASTPPGGAVHGLCGFYAAQAALRKQRA